MAHIAMTRLKETSLMGWHKRMMELLRPLYNLVCEMFHSVYVKTDKSKPAIEEMKEWLETEGLRYSQSCSRVRL